MPQEIHTLPLSEACDLAGVIPTLKYIADWCAHEYQRATEQTSIDAGDADKFRYLAEQLRRVLTDVPDGSRRKFTVIRWQSDSDTIKFQHVEAETPHDASINNHDQGHLIAVLEGWQHDSL